MDTGKDGVLTRSQLMRFVEIIIEMIFDAHRRANGTTAADPRFGDQALATALQDAPRYQRTLMSYVHADSTDRTLFGRRQVLNAAMVRLEPMLLEAIIFEGDSVRLKPPPRVPGSAEPVPLRVCTEICVVS